MFITTNNFDYWKLLNIENIIFKDNGIDLSKCDIKILNHKLNYKETLKYFIDLHNLINLLEKNSLSFFFIDKNDLLVINDTLYVINDKNIIELDKNNYFTIINNIKIKTKYLPPEFKYEIPLKLYKSFCYFQICNLLKDYLILSFEYIKHTPLYYSILRGLEKNPLKRFLIII